MPRKTTPNHDRVAVHLHRGPGALDGVCFPHHAPHTDSAAAVDSDKLALIGKQHIFPILNRKMCMLSGHVFSLAHSLVIKCTTHGANGQQLCHDLGLFFLARDGAHGQIGGQDECFQIWTARQKYCQSIHEKDHGQEEHFLTG